MRKAARLAWLLPLLVGLPLPASSQTVKIPPRAPAAKSPDSCAQVMGNVRAEAYGYTHVVTLLNRCDKPVSCEVWTDVDPTPRSTLTAQPGESVDTVTRIGSPARAVTAYKQCRFL